MATDISERGLEREICRALSGDACDPPGAATVGALPEGAGGVGWCPGNPHDYDREYCVDVVQLAAFLRATQPATAAELNLDDDNPSRRAFLKRLRDQVDERGVVEVLRNCIKYKTHNIFLYYGAPTPGNTEAEEQFRQNRFSVCRQLKYNPHSEHALDMGLFVNGLPVFTVELKNNLTGQNAENAIVQYGNDRDHKNPLFRLGRCVAHFAMDENVVFFCTHLQGKDSVFLPFNRGYKDGGGNPPADSGYKVAYWWEEVLRREKLADILDNYAQMTKDKRAQIFPRYHQLDVVRKLLAAARKDGVGKRYLVQHSAGSGKSNSIAWLAHQLIDLQKDGRAVFDSVVVVSDRRILDSQIRDTIRQFNQVGANFGHAQTSQDLRRFMESGKKIIVTTMQKFPHILSGMGGALNCRRFAVIIDEAHSGQGGKVTRAMSEALKKGGVEICPDDDTDDILEKCIEQRRLPDNASYFAFTATPKPKTLDIFGAAGEASPDGRAPRFVFHHYAMKQAIDEKFILDVLAHYTPIKSYFNLMQKAADNPHFDSKKAQKKLRRFVDRHPDTIAKKAEVMTEHFRRQVAHKIHGQARAMVVTGSIEQAVKYYYAIGACLRDGGGNRYRVLVAFSGDYEHGGKTVTEEGLNGFASGQIPEQFRRGDYRFLVCADKFQTGYDEPLLHTMYVDKHLSDIKAVQTLSRLNRMYPHKRDVGVLDFVNDTATIRDAFSPYYRQTILSDTTDPDKLHDLQTKLDMAGVYSQADVDRLVGLYWKEGTREQLEPILNACVENYRGNLVEEDEQAEFKGGVKSFLRGYAFLSCILPDNYPEWEKRFIFLALLIRKLPMPKEEDLSKGLLNLIDIETFRMEKSGEEKIVLADEVGEIDPPQFGPEGERPEPLLARLDDIIAEFNRRYGDAFGDDKDAVRKMITEEIPDLVAKTEKFRNAKKHSGRDNARRESDDALEDIMEDVVIEKEEQLYKKYRDDDDFKEWLKARIFDLVYSV